MSTAGAVGDVHPSPGSGAPGGPAATRATTDSAWFLAAMWTLALVGSLMGRIAVAAVFLLVAIRLSLNWYRAAHETARTRSLASAGDVAAVRRLFVRPAVALCVLVGAWALLSLVSDLKWSSFLWEGLPARTVDGRTYAWPGVYATETLQPGRSWGASWYATGGPFVPLPDDTPDAAAARVVRYLHERFDVTADAAEVERTLAAHRGETPPESLRAAPGVADHPYTAGMAALEAEYSPAVLRALLARTLATVPLLLLLGAATIRLGVARPPPWIDARPVRISVAAVTLGALPATFLTDVDLHAFRIGVRILRLPAAHPVWTTAAAAGIAAWLLAASFRRARELETELARGAAS